MRSDARTVADYIAQAPVERHQALELLRRMCREELPGFDETMRYGMPCYLRAGAVEVAFASQKACISLYVLRQSALQENLEQLVGLSLGKGCIRFRRPDQIDPAVVRDLLIDTAKGRGPVC